MLESTEDVMSSITGFNVSDVDVGNAVVGITFGGPSSIILGGPATNGVFAVAGSGLSSRTLTGTHADINAYIAAGFLTIITTTNSTNGGTFFATGGGSSISVPLLITPVNDTPAITAPATITVTSGVASALTGISFVDVESGTNDVSVTLSVPSGTLTATSSGGVAVTGSGATTLTLTGTTTNINAFITGSAAKLSTTASLTLTVSIDDLGHSGTGGNQTASKTISILVPDNIAPVPFGIRRHNPVAPTTASTNLIFRVFFSEVVTGVDLVDFTVVTTGSAAGTLASITPGPSQAFYVTVAASGLGTVHLDLKSSGTGIADPSGNGVTGGFTFGDTYTLAAPQAFFAWGRNQASQLGNGTNVNSSVPVRVSSGAIANKTVIALSGGALHSLALTVDGGVFGWGSGGSGQLGTTVPGNEISLTPISPDLTGVLNGKRLVAIAAGQYHTLALDSDGLVYGWGYNIGQLGNGSSFNSVPPVAVNTGGALAGKKIVAIAAGGSHSLLLSSDGLVYAMGGNSFGQLGNGSLTNSTLPLPVDVSGVLAGKTVIAIAAGASHSLALTTDNRLYAWGLNVAGQLGNGSATNSAVPVQVTTSAAVFDTSIIAVAAGATHSLALGSDGLVRAWGGNFNGQIGNGSNTNCASPVLVNSSGALSGKTIVAIAGGATHSVALGSDGQVYEWGLNTYGQLGNNSTLDTNAPVVVVSGGVLTNGTISTIASGSMPDHAMALATAAAAPGPSIVSVTPPTNGNYRAGLDLDFTVTFDQAIVLNTGGGAPSLSLTVGSTNRSAAFVSTVSTNALLFRYTVPAGDNDNDGITIVSPLVLNGATITNTAGAASLTVPLPNTSGVLVDTTVPVIAIGSPSTTVSRFGPVNFTITYTDANFGASTLATANITLNTTGTATGTVQVAGSGTTRTVTISSITGTGAIGISVAAGTGADTAGNLTAAAGPSATFTVDNSGPTVDISSPSTTLTSSGPVNYTVTYADPLLDQIFLSPTGIVLNATGTANGTVVVTGSGANSRTVTITNITGNGTLGISITAGSGRDDLNNFSPAAGPSATFAVDNLAPSIAVSAPSTNLTRSGPVTFTVTYSDADFASSTLATGNITLNTTGTATGAIGVSGSGTTRTVTISSITGTGTLGISIAAGTATDTAGNAAPASGPSATFEVDNTAPTINLSAPSGAITSSNSITYTVTYADTNFSASTLASGNITLNTTGTATGAIGVSGSGATRTVTISSISGNGTLGISIGAGTATDAVGNLAPAAGPSATFTADNTAPTIGISAPSVSITRAGPVTFTVTYADANFDASTLVSGNITLNNTGTANGSIGVSGSGATRTVTISSITGNGTLGISIAAGTAIDTAGNTAPAAGPSATFTVDSTAPSVPVFTSITTDTGLSATDRNTTDQTLVLAGTSEASSTIIVSRAGTGVIGTTNATEGGAWSFDYTGTTLPEGSHTFTAIAVDTLGNTGSVSADFVVTVDTTAPTIGISAPSTNLTAGGPVTFTVTYTDANFGTSTLTTANITLNTNGSANGTLAVSGTGNTRTVTVSNITGDGTLGISIAAGTASDLAGNLAPASSASATFAVDNAAPNVDISLPSVSETAGGPVTYTVSYFENNFSASTLVATNITLNRTGSANGTIGVSGTGSSRTVTISGITGDGTLGISIAAGTATDAAGNLAPAAGPSQTFLVDNASPNINLSDPSSTNTSTGPVTYTVSYFDNNFSTSTLATANITLNKTGTADGTLGVSGTGTTRTVTISGITGNGTLGISIAAGTASDRLGNLAPAVGPSAAFTVDNTGPAITISAPSVSSTRNGPVTYTVTYTDSQFSESTLATGNITLNKTGDADGTVAVSGTGNTRTVTISSITGNGTLGISIAAGTASDLVGNLAPAAGPSTTFIVNGSAPSIAISAPSASVTTTGPVTYSVTYTDDNFDTSTLSTSDITLNTTGTATGTLGVSGSGTNRTVTISSITGNGTLGISIAAGTATDLTGNLAPAAGPSATFLVDNIAPTIAISVPSTNLTRTGPVTFAITYADANFVSSTLATDNLTLNKTGTANATVGVSGSGATRTVTLSSITGDGTLGISVSSGTATDSAGLQAPAAGPSATINVDNTGPAITISAPSASATQVGPITYTVTYTDPNFSASTLASGNITLNQTGTANALVSVSGTGNTRTVTLFAITGVGTLGISIGSETASDTLGNVSLAAGPSGTVTITDNLAPTLSGLRNVAWGDVSVKAESLVIFTNALVTDPDSADFNGGNVTLNYTDGGSAEDQLSIRNEGTGANQIGFSSNIVTFGGVAMATVPASGVGSGQNGASLIITFTSTAATTNSVARLIQNITYHNTSATNPVVSRTLAVTVSDGDGGASDPVGSVIVIFPTQPSVVDRSSTRYLQTGLMQQTLVISNPAPFAFAAIRATVVFSAAEKAAGARLYNATGTNAVGDAFVQYNSPLPPTALVSITLEYYVPNRTTVPSPEFIVETAVPQTPPVLTGAEQPVLQQRILPPDNVVLIAFSTQAGATYYVLYSSDMEEWKVALPPITGTGNSVQWVDQGPPKTDSHPATQPQRFYKVLKAD